jgi:hypothetical protein
MTDLKMCREVVLYDPISPRYIKSVHWVPIDPQPCCETCSNKERLCLIVKKVPDTDMGWFYCRCWEAKK